MILSCNYEELRALTSGADLLLSSPDERERAAEGRLDVEALQSRLVGDIEVPTTQDQRSLRRAVGLTTDMLHRRMVATILEHHPAHEEAVLLYFDYAHSLGVLARLDAIGLELEALEELLDGARV